MIKRITKLTGLLMTVASIVSVMPVQAADIQTAATQDGTISSAKAKGNGIFIDGEVNGADEAVYWMSDDGKYNKLDVDTGSAMTDELMNQYLEVDTGAKDLTYIDIKNGYKEADTDRESLESTVATTVKAKLRHDDNGRFDKNTLNGDTTGFTSLYNRENTIPKPSTSTGKLQVGFVSGSDGLSIFQVPLKDALDPGITNNITYYNSYSDPTSKATAISNTSAIYADATGNYVDADYNLGSLKIYAGTTTGASVTLNNTKDSYDITKNGQTVHLKAVLQEKSYIAEASDTVYRWAYLTIYKSTDGTTYLPVTAADNLIYQDSDTHRKGITSSSLPLNVAGTKTVLQKFSKTPASDTVDGIKYSKDSTIYFVADKDGVDKSASLLTKTKANDKALCNFGMVGSTFKAQNLIPSHKNSFNYLDFGDEDSSDIDSISYPDAGGVPYFTNSGYLMTWDGDHSFVKVAKVDAGLDYISAGSKTKIVLYDPDKSIHAIINVPKAAAATTGTSTTATTTGAAATVSTTQNAGWTKNSDNTWNYLENGTKKTGWLKDSGTWYYLKSDGVMATSWVNDNGTWYYLNASGAMKTGWINDAGTWYYCNESGSMLSNTTIDGYVLGTDGAWIK